MAFGPAEYFALILFCLIAVSTIGGSDPAKNTVMAAIGALAGTIGIDIYDGTERYTFGFQYLLEGPHLVPLAMGLFVLSEVIASLRGRDYRPRHAVRLRAMLPTEIGRAHV